MEAIAEAGRADLAGLVNFLFGLFVVFGGLALLLVAVACRRMGIAGYRRMVWFALLSLCGGVWCLFDPDSILPILPHPHAVYTISALAEHGMAITFVGYVRTCAGPRGARVGLVLIWVEAGLVLVQAVSQAIGAWTLFQFSGISIAIQLLCLPVLLIAFASDRHDRKGDPIDYHALLVFAPCVVGAVVAALLYYLYGSEGPWFGMGFAVTMVAQVGVVMRYIKRQAEEAARAQKLERELVQSKITLMISQIQPHFLYNALNTIQYLCEDRPRVAADTVNRLAKYLRGNVDSLVSDALIPVVRDLEHVQHYLAIEKLRFPEVEVIFRIEDTGFCVPPLTLQPLVENAIRHGLGPRGHQGTVSVAIWEEDDAHCLEIADDGVGFDPAIVHEMRDEARSHVGLQNTARRLEWMCQGTLIVGSSSGQGATVFLSIPKTPPDGGCGEGE